MQTTIEPEHLIALLQPEGAKQRDDSSVKVLFTSMNKAPATKPTIVQRTNAYIPQSILFDFESRFVDKNSALEHMMPPVDLFKSEAAKLNLGADDEIVIYDDFGNFCASRVWFMFTTMGFKNVRVLQGGLPNWLALNYPTQKVLSNPTSTKTTVDLKPNALIKFVDKNFILSIVAQKAGFEQIQIVDARSFGRFQGTEPEPRANMSSGHMPGAISLHYAQLLDNGKFKEINRLQELFEKAGVDMNLPIVTSCGSGVTACIVAQAFYELGNREMYVYDGSWSEWGAGNSFPIETLKKDNH